MIFRNSAKVSEDYCKSFYFGKGCMHYKGRFPCDQAVTIDFVDGYVKNRIRRLKEEVGNIEVVVKDMDAEKRPCEPNRNL